MTTLNPLTPIANRLYSVQLAERCYVNGIEAPNAHDAMRQAETDFGSDPNKYVGKSLSATSEPIYEASIGLETDGRDNAPDDLDTENGVFEVKIRGCDPKRVNELKLALLLLLGHPGMDEEDERLCGDVAPLKRALDGVMVTDF